MISENLSVPLPHSSSTRQCLFNRLVRPELLLFVLLNILDLMLTMKLLRTGSFYESNPVANYFLFSGGPLGMIVYKGAVVSMTLIAISLLARFRRGIARTILNFGSVVFGSVVVYSSILLYWFATR